MHGGHGGVRPGAGRPVGAVRRTTLEVRHRLGPLAEVAIPRLQELLKSSDDRLVLQAIELVFLYAYGRPAAAPVDIEHEASRRVRPEEFESLSDEELKALAGIR